MSSAAEAARLERMERAGLVLLVLLNAHARAVSAADTIRVAPAMAKELVGVAYRYTDELIKQGGSPP